MTLCATVCAMFFCLSAAAASLPSLQQDASISDGLLPNGAAYYIAVNPSEKSSVEFALVQKLNAVSGADASRDAGGAMSALDRFGGRTAREFLSGNSAFCDDVQDEMLDLREDAVIYRFGRLAVSDELMDSVLLMIFDMVEEKGTGGRGTSVTDYAIVVSGDVDKDAMLTRLRHFSMMVPVRSSDAVTRQAYTPASSGEVEFVLTEQPTADLTGISLIYKIPRVPEEYMGTTVPFVAEYMGNMLCSVLETRIHAGLKAAGLPVTGLSCRYVGSAAQAGDEEVEIRMETAAEYLDDVLSVLSSALASADEAALSTRDFPSFRKEYLFGLYAKSVAPTVSNEENIGRCVSSFLYGTALPDRKERLTGLIKGRVADTTHVRLFNTYASGVLSSSHNVSIRLKGNIPLGEEELKHRFLSSWKSETGLKTGRSQDSLVSAKALADKLKLSSSRKENASKGVLWTFDNGMKVIYKRMTTNSLFRYDLKLRGGRRELEGMTAEETAGLASVLSCYNVGGMDGDAFRRHCSSSDFTMDIDVSRMGMDISGLASYASLPMLFEALIALANEREESPESYRYLALCERLKPGMKTVFDEELPAKAAKYFDECFSRMNEGVLIIVGDMEETAMRKLLQTQLMYFHTGAASPRRIRVPYRQADALSSCDSVDVNLSAPMAFTADNYVLASLARVVLEDALNQALCGKGAAAAVSFEFVDLPQERLELMISLKEMNLDRLPSDERRISAGEMGEIVDGVLARLSSVSLSGNSLDAYKSMLKNDVSSCRQKEEYWISVIATRFFRGKDLNSRYEEKTDALTAERLRSLFYALL